MAFRPLRPAIATKRAGYRAAPVLPPGVVRVPAPPKLPSLPISPKRPSSARIASRPAACHASSLIKAYARRDSPLHRRKVPSRLSRAIPAPRKQARERKRERKHSVLLHSPASPLPPLRPYGMPYFKQPPDSDGDFRPDLKKVFSGMGRAREGKGQFLQKTPLPLSSFPAPQPLHNKKAGQSPAPAFTGKTKERGCVTSFHRYA